MTSESPPTVLIGERNPLPPYSRAEELARNYHQRVKPVLQAQEREYITERLPQSETLLQTRCRQRQDAFLRAFASLGNANETCGVVDVPYPTYRDWVREDTMGFRVRLEQAQGQYGDLMDSLIRQRLLEPQGNRGGDILLMYAANIYHPERRYDRSMDKAQIEEARQLNRELQKSARALRRASKNADLERV